MRTIMDINKCFNSFLPLYTDSSKQWSRAVVDCRFFIWSVFRLQIQLAIITQPIFQQQINGNCCPSLPNWHRCCVNQKLRVVKFGTVPSLEVFFKFTEVIIHKIILSHLRLLSFHSPINFLRSSKSNRFAIAATFGATASTCLILFADPNHMKFFPEGSHPWVKGINAL